MSDYENLNPEDISSFDENEFEVSEDISVVESSSCPNCEIKMDRIVENKSLFDGSVTFHIVKFRCPECGKKFLDLDQAQKYDTYLKLKSLSFSDLGKVVNSVSA